MDNQFYLHRLERFFLDKGMDPSGIEMYGPAGSIIHGLQTDSSDTDIFAIHRELNKSIQEIQGEYDFIIHGPKTIGQKILDGAPNLIDLIFQDSGFMFDGPSNIWRPYITNIRPNMNNYRLKSESMIMERLKQIISNPYSKRSAKSIKIAYRTSIMYHRSLDLENPSRIHTWFSDSDRAIFYETLPILTNSIIRSIEKNNPSSNSKSESSREFRSFTMETIHRFTRENGF